MVLRDAKRAIGLGAFADLFDISRDSAKRAVKTGALKTILIGGRRLVPMSEVERVEREGLPRRRYGTAAVV
jgi:hypothetical protein